MTNSYTPHQSNQQYSTPNPYQQNLQTPAVNPYAPPPQGAKSAALGIVGLALVMVTALLACVMTYMGSGMASEVMRLYPNNETPEVLPADQQSTMMMAGLLWIGAGLASLVGIVGWVLSIVATTSNRGRTWGIVGIIVGVLAPVAIVVCLAVPVAAL